MRPLEVFCGLYKDAAILHFSVSAARAKSSQSDCGGSGRGLPTDARPHVFSSTFPITKWSLPTRTPSGRTFCIDKGRLQHSNYGLHSVFCFFSCLNASGNGVGCCVRGRPGDAAAAAAAAAPAAASDPSIQPPPRHRFWDLPATT